jgi:eukaryotic-like serine/threonine-protein kinase
MKRCPQCNRIETDDALVYCRADGTRLVSFDREAPTVAFAETPTAMRPEKVRSRARQSGRSKAIDSIAVLPFENASNDPNAEYLSDGITESIINNLSQLPKLKVMARSTVFRFKNQQVDPQRVGNDLGVRAVVTGRVLPRGDHLTLGIELVDVADGSQLWGERYSQQMADILAVQEEIASQIINNLRLKLTGSQKNRLAKRHTKDSEAYQLYLKGRYFWNKRTEEDANRGIEHFQKSLALDPNFALAYSGLADCQTLLGDVGVQAMLPREAFLQGEQSVARALELDESLAEAHGTMGHVSMHLFDWTRAEKELGRALELNPNYAQACVWHAYYLAFTGEFADSIAAINRALQLDPLSLPVSRSAAELLYYAGRLDESIDLFHKSIEMEAHYIAHAELGRVYEHRELYDLAIAEFKKARELSHDIPESVAELAHCYAVSGAKSEAQSLLGELLGRSNHRYVSPYALALIYSGLGQKEKVFEWLNRAFEINDGWMIYITVDPRWKNLRADADFIHMVQRVGLPMK